MKALLGTKLNQSQTFTPEGKRISVTTITAGPCFVARITDGNGYRSLQLGFGVAKHTTKAIEGHMKKAGLEQKPRFLREVRTDATEEVAVGREINVADVFTAGDAIRVTGVSKGKGFAGVVKRHGFAGMPRTHGTSDRERAPGSIGQTTTPGRVYRGKRMAGRLGNDQVTVTGLKVVAVDSEKNLLTVSGVVPGAKGGLVVITKE